MEPINYDQHKKWQEAIETARSAAKAQDDSLAMAEISDEIKLKIRNKFIELAMKFPHMKRDRLMRKAGDYYGIKFQFE